MNKWGFVFMTVFKSVCFKIVSWEIACKWKIKQKLYYLGIETYEYVADKYMFGNGTVNPENKVEYPRCSLFLIKLFHSLLLLAWVVMSLKWNVRLIFSVTILQMFPCPRECSIPACAGTDYICSCVSDPDLDPCGSVLKWCQDPYWGLRIPDPNWEYRLRICIQESQNDV